MLIHCVEVVEDARQNFAASAKVEAPLPSLPAAPRKGSHNCSTHSSRLPRKLLAASEIFAEYNNSPQAGTSYTANTSVVGTSESTSSRGTPPTLTDATSLSISSPRTSAPPSRNQLLVPEIHTPPRKRRATVSDNSPIAIHRDSEMSPSKIREKSRSHGNLLQQRIASLTQLEAEFNKRESLA
jgi:serine/threonine-protein kinase GIN4